MMASGWKKLAIVVVGVVLVFVVARIGYRVFFDPVLAPILQTRIESLVSSIVGPRELRDVVFVLSPHRNGGLYEEASRGRNAFAMGSGALDVAFSSEEKEAVLVFDGQHDTYDVFVEGNRIYSSDTIKQSLAISPDGLRVSFAEAKSGSDLSQPDAWSVTTLIAETGEVVWSAPGFAVFFTDNEKALRFTAKGVVFAPIFTSEDAVALENPVTKVYLPAQSPDRTKIAFHRESNEAAEVYTVDESGTITLLKTLTASRGFLALSNDVAYRVEVGDTGSSLWRYPFSNNERGKKVRTFPADFSPVRIIFK